MKILTLGQPVRRPTAVAMGLFDGLHPGHLAVIQKTMGFSLIPTVFTFVYDNPAEVTKTGYARLLSPTLKMALLEKAGVEAVLSPNFSTIQSLAPEEFFQKVLVNTLQAKAVFCGYDFRFGRQAAGDGETLRQLCAKANIRFEQLPAMTWDGSPISSTRIREAVREGDMQLAARIMDRPYAIDFPVVHGRHMGRAVFGFPTINQLYQPEDLLPRFGVYESRVEIDGRWYKGVTNVGVKPTVGGDLPGAETFILDYDGDLYGQSPLVCFCLFLRGEKRFPSFDALKAQIESDARQVAVSTEFPRRDFWGKKFF